MRISATQLESFRLFLQPDQEWMSEADLLATLRGEFTPTPKMALGTAFGAVLEDPDRYAVRGFTADQTTAYQCGGYTFSADMMAPALAMFDRRGVFEAKATKAYGPHVVVAKADQLLGAQIIENKTTLSSFDFEKYANSYQWRFMADIFEPAFITYRVFLLAENDAGIPSLRGIEEFNLFPYADLHQDCCALLDTFVAYATAMGVADVLNERQRLAEVA